MAFSGKTKFGVSESHFTACLPVMLRPSPPRFLNYGDKEINICVVVQNQTDQQQDVNVIARSKNLDFITESGSANNNNSAAFGHLKGYRKVHIEPNARQEVYFKSNAKAPGRARVQFVAILGDEEDSQFIADTAKISFPVWTPATTEAFATCGELDNECTLYCI
jgi:hypothetical protein